MHTEHQLNILASRPYKSYIICYDNEMSILLLMCVCVCCFQDLLDKSFKKNPCTLLFYNIHRV